MPMFFAENEESDEGGFVSFLRAVTHAVVAANAAYQASDTSDASKFFAERFRREFDRKLVGSVLDPIREISEGPQKRTKFRRTNVSGQPWARDAYVDAFQHRYRLARCAAGFRRRDVVDVAGCEYSPGRAFVPCVYCGARSVLADHVPPLSQAVIYSEDDPHRFYPACYDCNNALGADARLCLHERALLVLALLRRSDSDSDDDRRAWRIFNLVRFDDLRDLCECPDCERRRQI